MVRGHLVGRILAQSAIVGFCWPVRVTAITKPTSLFNFPMQANGAEMMRLAAIAGTEAGIEICGPVHDAFLIGAPLDRLDADIALMRAIMRRAGEAVTGIPVNVEVEETRWPSRMTEVKGAPMFNKIRELGALYPPTLNEYIYHTYLYLPYLPNSPTHLPTLYK